jgi:hypothetical protein
VYNQSEKQDNNQAKGLFAESFTIAPNENIQNYLDLSPEKKSHIFHLEKSILEQNKRISKQISLFFEKAKETIHKSLQQIKKTNKSYSNQVIPSYHYSYIGKESKKPKNLSFREIPKIGKSSKNMKFALERDSMKKLDEQISNIQKQRLKISTPKAKGSKNLFKSGGSHPKIYSRRNMKLINNSIEQKVKRNSKKQENISDSMRGITAIDFGTLGKEGNTIWIKDDSRTDLKPKFHYVDKIQKNSKSIENFQNKNTQKIVQTNKSTKIRHQQMMNHNKQNLTKKSLKDKKKLLQLKNKINNRRSRNNNDLIINEIIQDSELKSVISSMKPNTKHRIQNRAKSELPTKRTKKNRVPSFHFPESKYQLLRDLDKKIKQSRNQSKNSQFTEKNLDNESSILLKENQLKMREIRRNYMKKWKEKRKQEQSRSNHSLPKKYDRRSGYGQSKSTKTYSRNKVNQWAYYRTNGKNVKELSTMSNNSSLGSLNKPPLINFKRNQMPKDSISLYKKKKQSKSKSVKISTKEVKKKIKIPKSKKSKSRARKKIVDKRNKSRKGSKGSKGSKRTYTNKFESTKIAFQYVKDKKKRNISSQYYW